MKIKVALTDDHQLVLEGLKGMLAQHSEIEITGSYNNGKELLHGIQTIQPDILLLDIQLPDIPGNQLARIISEDYPTIGIIALSNMNTSYHITDMLTHGCMGYLLKSATADIIIEAIQEVHKGNQYLESSLRSELDMIFKQKKQTARLAPVFSDREKEIIKLIMEEKTSQQIAEQLSLSPRTVENHRYCIQQKLGVKNTVGLVKIVMQTGMVL